MQPTKFLLVLALAGALACQKGEREDADPENEERVRQDLARFEQERARQGSAPADQEKARQDSAHAKAGKPEHEKHWGYEGKEGPDHWGEVDAICQKGKAQSPVNLDVSLTHKSKELHFHYRPTKLDVVNNGHTVQVKADSGSYIEVDGMRYQLDQFHVHTPSEHTLHGRTLGGEVHLVHKDEGSGRSAVVGIWLDEDSSLEHDALDAFWSHLLTKVGEVKSDDTVNPNDFLPTVHKVFHYQGSLTAPPCSEGIEWFVMEEPIKVSSEHLAAFKRIFPHNNRPVQPLNDRTVE